MREQHALQQTTQPFRIPAACRTCWLIFLLFLRLFITDAISPAPLPQFHYLFLPRRPVSFLPSQSFSQRLLQLLPLLLPAPHPSPLLTGDVPKRSVPPVSPHPAPSLRPSPCSAACPLAFGSGLGPALPPASLNPIYCFPGEPFPAGCPQSTRLQRPFLQRCFLPSSEPLVL